MAIKENKKKIEVVLGGFLERSKDYVVEVYINNKESQVAQIFIASNRIFKVNVDRFILEWHTDCKTRINKFSLQYNNILNCYEQEIEYGNQMVTVIMKNGMNINFECRGAGKEE